MPFASDPAVGCRPRSGAGRRYSPVIIVAAHTLGPHLLPAEMMGWNPPAPSQRKPKLEPRTWLPVSVTATSGCGEAESRTPA